MGFRSVYKVLQEVFPKVDSRLLRAVAIEHSKDADTAVEVVLVEVIPYLSKQLTSPGSSDGSGSLQNPSEAVAESDAIARSDNALLVDSTCLDNSVNGSLMDSTCLDNSVNGSLFANCGSERGCGDNANDELNSLEKCEESSDVGPEMTSNVTSTALIHENGANDDHDRVYGNSENKGIFSLGKYEESCIEVAGVHQSSHVTLTTLKHGDTGASGSMNGHLDADWKDLNRSENCNSSLAVHGESNQEQLCIDDNTLEMENSVVQLAPPPVKKCVLNAPETSHQLILVPDMLVTDFEKPERSVASNAAFKEDITTSEMVDLEGDFTMNTVVTRSGQICSIDLIEDIIEDARSNKKTLLSAMDSVISLMKEVELQERAAEQAKEEAARGGFDILAKVEELKQQLRLAKEANDMHAGEVYGEKAILATEARELQSRLLSLSDERDKSLAILDEMRQTLEVRLTAAEKEMNAAEQEKLEKDESARNLLAQQNVVMEKVVQESKILKQEAEENSKLREFLMDRGSVVDMLQGEIHVKCQDVRRLKQKFDERIPLSKFLSASQTSSCFLASSSSSLKSSIEPDHMSELSDKHKKTSPASSDDQHSSGEEGVRDDRVSSGSDSKVLVDDEGWEFFRKERADRDDSKAITDRDDSKAITDRDDSKAITDKDDSKAIMDELLDQGWEFFDDNREFLA